MSTPITALPQLPAQSQIAGFDKGLRVRAIPKDIYTNLSGLYSREDQAIPNAIYMKVDGKALAGSNNVTITMKLPLQGPVVPGNVRLTGTEEAPQTKAGTIYRNNYKKAVRVETYNTRKLDQEAYGLYKKHINDLGVWAQEYEGLEIRQAVLETRGMSLYAGDTAAVGQPAWNPNFYVQGATDLQQPAFSPNNATYTNNIVNAIVAAGGFAQTAPQAATFELMNRLALQALRRRLYPLSINGNDAFILVVSPLQATIFADPTWTARTGSNTGGSVWIQRNELPDTVQRWHGIIGKWEGSIGADFYVVVDPRCPTLIPGGTAAPFSLTSGYMWPGSVDLRQHDNPNVRDACFLLGKMAIAKWEPEPLHFVTQDDDYARIMGHGIAGVRGIQQVHYDQQNPDATSLEYYGSMVVVMARPNY